MLRIFELGPAVCAPERRAYRDYLARRDGELDPLRGRLSRREERIARLAPDGPAPPGRAARFDRTRSYPGDELLLMSLAAVHAAFGFGSRREYRRALARASRDGDEIEAFVAAEHELGARLLGADAAARAAGEPPIGVTLLAGHAGPERWRPSFVLAAEIVHAVALLNLLRVTRDVLRNSPAVRDGVEERLHEVLTDAVGHIAYRRLGMDGAALERTRRLVPAVALVLGNRSPEMTALGASVFPSALTIAHRLENGLPAEVRASAFVA